MTKYRVYATYRNNHRPFELGEYLSLEEAEKIAMQFLKLNHHWELIINYKEDDCIIERTLGMTY